MILNNSGIVHCATRTRGREETAMNMQELLTYVEELTFKTSMFGYDKDEVDIQLDKICDEAEAIILAKEKEIEELKKESKTALGIAAAVKGDGKFDVIDKFADCIKREWNITGLRKGYMYMADCMTDPRWQRSYGTFGEDPDFIEEAFDHLMVQMVLQKTVWLLQ